MAIKHGTGDPDLYVSNGSTVAGVVTPLTQSSMTVGKMVVTKATYSVPSAKTLTIDNTDPFSGSSSATVNVSGTMAFGVSGTLTLDSVTITAASGATVSGAAVTDLEMSTSSSLTMQSGSTFSPALTTLNMVGGTLALNAGATISSHTVSTLGLTSGTLTIGDNLTFGYVSSTLTVGGATLTLGQNVAFSTGATTIALNSGNLTVSKGDTFGSAADTLTSLTVGDGTHTATFTMSYYTATAPLNVATVEVKNSGTITHTANTTSQTHVVSISSTNITVDSGGSINVDGKGYAGHLQTTGYGPGGGTSTGGGGAHGGNGGNSGNGGGIGGTAYDSAVKPAQIGSAGGGDSYNDSRCIGGAGGGLIILNASGTITLNGSISANAGSTLGFCSNGGGAGGGVYVSADTVTGTPTAFTATGGSGNAYGGGGGGGRVYVNYTDYGTWFATASSIVVTGGAKGGDGGSQNGSNGTAYVNAAPVLSALATPTEATDGSGNVTVSVGVNDTDYDSSKMKVQYKAGSDCSSGTSAATLGSTVTATYSDTGGAPTVDNTLSYQIGNTSGYKIVTKSTGTNTITFTWNSKTDVPSADGTYCLALTANDGVKDSTVATTSFTLDNAAPTAGNVKIDASGTNLDGSASSTASLTFSATDSHAVSMSYSLTDTTGGSSWAPIGSATVSIGTSATTTVYARFEDAYGNVSSATSATIPDQPTNVIVVDASNLTMTPASYGLLVAWKKDGTLTSGTFGSYKVFRSPDQSTWTQVGTSSSIDQNYYVDYTTVTGTNYYYRVDTVSANGDVSRYSTYTAGTLWTGNAVYGDANGVVDGGEGGGGTYGPAAFSSVTATSVDPTREDITWNTDILANSAVGYSTTSGVFSTTVSNSALLDKDSDVGHHVIHLTGLAPGTTYYYDVNSTNVSSVGSVSNNGGGGYTFATPAGATISNVVYGSVENTSAHVTWTTSASADSTVVYSTDGTFATSSTATSSTAATSHDVKLTGLSAGTKYYFYVSSAVSGGATTTDKNYANGSPAYYSFTTTNSATAPVIQGGASPVSTLVFTTSVTINWTTDTLSDSAIAYGTTSGDYTLSASDATDTITHSLTLDSLASNTKYYFTVSSTDVNGNKTTSSEENFTTLTPPDVTPPVLSSVAAGSLTLTGATVTWTTDEASNGTVDYGTTNSYGSVAGSATDFTATSHAVALTGLANGTTYHFRVNSTDASGNTSSSADDTFTTTADTTAPTISSANALANQTGAYVAWDTDEAANSEVDYGTTLSYGSSATALTTYGATHAIEISGLASNTAYDYRIVTADAAGNSSTSTGTFTTVAVPDTTAPTLSSVAAGSLTLTGATVAWTTDEASNGTVDYGPTNSYGSVAGSATDFAATSHAVALTGLANGTKYYFRVNSTDASGNTASSAGSNFTTVADTTAPTISSASALATDASAVITWDTSEAADSQVAYGLTDAYGSTTTLDATLSATHSVEIDGLTKGKTYHYQILSSDAAGNKGATADATFATLAGTKSGGGGGAVAAASPSTATPPVISGLAVSGITQTGATVTWGTDANGLSLVKFGATAAYGSLAGDVTTYGTAHQVGLADLSPATTYHFVAESFDRNGNLGASDDQTFTTLNAAGETVAPSPTPAPAPSAPAAAPLPPSPFGGLSLEDFISKEVKDGSAALLQKVLLSVGDNPALRNIPEDAIARTISDITKIVVSNPQLVGPKPQVTVEGTNALISWHTDKKTNGVVSYAAAAQYQPLSLQPYATTVIDNAGLVSSHAVALPNLQPSRRTISR